MIKYKGISLSSGYELEFETIESIANHIQNNLDNLYEIETNNGNEVGADECDTSKDVLRDYMNQYDGENVEETLENFNNFADLIQYEYERIG